MHNNKTKNKMETAIDYWANIPLHFKTENKMNLDDYKTGQFDSASPINQIETDTETVTGYDTLSQAYYSGFEDAFLDKQIEILHELNVILETSKAIDFGMLSRIERLINKCK